MLLTPLFDRRRRRRGLKVDSRAAVMMDYNAHTALVMIEVLLAILLFGKLVISPAQRMRMTAFIGISCPDDIDP